jgi:hypothetical protein
MRKYDVALVVDGVLDQIENGVDTGVLLGAECACESFGAIGLELRAREAGAHNLLTGQD